MNDSTIKEYDVAIMGGGPAGATLGTLLANQTNLRIAIFEKERFPRDHIGESFSHRIIPVLAESGALAKVLASECWVKKFGGYYAWDGKVPAATLFEHDQQLRDGVVRWAIHCDRSEFDAILLDHAKESGVDVFEETAVSKVERDGDGHVVTTGDGQRIRASLFVEASGRQTSVVTRQQKEFLSRYKNVALWQHVVDGKPAQAADGDWNIFREEDRSAIGCFAFEDGWFWYIPVPKVVNGERIMTHSLGLVTGPDVLTDPSKPYREPGRLLELARTVPILCDLLVDARPVYDRVQVATNYSMISEQFCDYDGRWMVIGDSAHFVDPLFSSGVAFALVYAATSALLIRTTFDESVSAADKRELWNDFNEDWHSVARSFALAIDQWYHAISEKHPSSTYWKRRADSPLDDVRDQTFHALVDTDISPDLIQVLGNGGSGGVASGPLSDARRRFAGEGIADESVVRLREGVSVRESRTLEVVRVKAASEVEADAAKIERMARYWEDPVTASDAMGPLYPSPIACHKFYFEGDTHSAPVKFHDAIDGGLAIFDRLRGAQTVAYGDLRTSLDERQMRLLNRLCVAGFVDVAAPGASA